MGSNMVEAVVVAKQSGKGPLPYCCSVVIHSSADDGWVKCEGLESEMKPTRSEGAT